MLRKYAALMRAGWASTMEYRAEIVLWMMSSLFLVIMLLVWLSVAQSQGGTVNGFAAPDFVSYFIVGWVLRNSTAVWASWELDRMVREGSLSPVLLRPILPVNNDIAFNLAEKGLRLVIVLPIAALVLWLTPHTPLAVTPLNAAALVVSVVGAWLILFWADYCLGILAFWTTQATAFVEAWFAIRLTLSGMIAPIQMFPVWLQGVLDWLPFRYMLAFPIDIITGRAPFERLAFGLAVQFAWAALFFALAQVMWRRAMRSYSAVGA